MARVGEVRNPATNGMPTNPSLPTKPTSTLFAVGEDAENRNQAGVAEVGGLQGVARLMQHVMGFQAHEFQLWEKCLAFFGREVEQNLRHEFGFRPRRGEAVSERALQTNVSGWP